MSSVNSYFESVAVLETYREWEPPPAVVAMSRCLYARHGEPDDHVDHPLGGMHARRAQVVVTAMVDRQVVGFAQLGSVGSAAYLHSLWVEPEQRSRNIGRALVLGSARAALDDGTTQLFVDPMSWREHDRLVHFYEEVGFVDKCAWLRSCRRGRDECRFYLMCHPTWIIAVAEDPHYRPRTFTPYVCPDLKCRECPSDPSTKRRIVRATERRRRRTLEDFRELQKSAGALHREHTALLEGPAQ